MSDITDMRHIRDMASWIYGYEGYGRPVGYTDMKIRGNDWRNTTYGLHDSRLWLAGHSLF